MEKEELDLVNNISWSESMARVEINRCSPVAFVVNTLCDCISQLAGQPVEKRQKARNWL